MSGYELGFAGNDKVAELGDSAKKGEGGYGIITGNYNRNFVK